MTELTREELAKYNGKEGRPAYIAYYGKIYDVTNSFLWKGGIHQVIHNAGKDLTDELKNAPHGASLLSRVPVIGILKG